MSSNAIAIAGVGKRYTIGAAARPMNFRESLVAAATAQAGERKRPPISGRCAT